MWTLLREASARCKISKATGRVQYTVESPWERSPTGFNIQLKIYIKNVLAKQDDIGCKSISRYV